MIGFSWDSNTRSGPEGLAGFDDGKANGPKLANILDDYRAMCPAVRLHLLGHSLGAAVDNEEPRVRSASAGPSRPRSGR